MDIQTLANQIMAVDRPEGIISIDIDAMLRKEACVHLRRDALLAAVSMEDLERTEFDRQYDKLQTIINGVKFFCLAPRQNDCPRCGGKK